MPTEKTIKKSKRGLTFSFPSTGKLSIGSRYDYIIDKNSRSICIQPAVDGSHTVSRKKSGEGWSSLIDLRSREVLDTISKMESIRVSISEDSITVSDACTKSRTNILMFPRSVIRNLRMAAGLENDAAVSSLLEGAQISLDEYLSSTRDHLDISSIHEDLADIYTVVSLFSGAGILDWSFAQDNRFQIQYAIDYDAAACETYRRNIGLHVVHGDVHKAFTKDGYPLERLVRDPDIIVGGPSCKPFSNANRRKRLEEHPDSDLLVQYMRIVKTLRPKVFAIENVPAVLTACDGEYFDAIKTAAADCGYILSAKVVQDDRVGGFTTRKRAVILGSRVGKVKFPGVELAYGTHTAGEALRKVTPQWSNYADVTIPSPDVKKRMSFVPQGGNFENIPEEYRTESKNRHSCTYRRLSLDAPSPTIVNWRKPPLIHPTEDRTLTVAEAKALQGLPGHFRICGTLGQMQQQVGNSVPVAIGRFIKNAILATLGVNSMRYA